MAARATLVLCLLASSIGAPEAARTSSLERARTAVEQRHSNKVVVARQGLDPDTARDIPKILQAASGLAIALMTAYNDPDPDIEYALENLNLQGWQLVKAIVPKGQQGSDGMARAKVAWDDAFADLPQVIDQVKSSYKSGDTKAILEATLHVIDVGLRAAAKVDTEQAKYITAIADLAGELGAEVSSFGSEMGLLGVHGASLAQIEGGSQAGRFDPENMNKLLTTCVGLATTFLAAANEHPPDFDYAISSFKLQGWQMAKILVPKDVQAQPTFKKAKKAWDEVFNQAPDLAQKALTAYDEGDADKVVDVVVGTLTMGLAAASHVDEAHAKTFGAMSTLISGASKSMLKFSHSVGWLD